MSAGGSTPAIGPSLVAQASRCLHFYRQEVFGDPAGRLPVSAGRQTELDHGKEFERRAISSLAGVVAVEWDRRDWDEGVRRTQAVLRAGHPWVAGAALVGDGLRGIADLLRRVDGKGGPGGARYIPVEIKNHKKVESADVVQVTGYAVLMESSLGYRPERGGVLLNTGRVKGVEIDKGLVDRFQALAARMRQVASGETDTEPVWCSACRNCPWLKACTERWHATDHLSLLPNGGKTTVTKLYAAGIGTVKALAAEEFDQLHARVPMSEKTLKALWLHARARAEGKPILLKKAEPGSDGPLYFYDIETFGDEVFLHGLIRVAGGNREEHFFFAERPEEASGAWHKLLEFLGGKAAMEDSATDSGGWRLTDPHARVLTWTTFENDFVKACWERFGGNRLGYSVLLNGLEDQCAWVKKHFALPVRSYSIKEVAPTFGFHWQDQDAGGTNCEAWYGEWLRSGDPALHEKILRYNRDDVLAMEVIDKELRAVGWREREEAT